MGRQLHIHRNEEDAEDYLVPEVLSLCHFSGVGPRCLQMLLQRFGDPTQIMQTGRDALLRIDGMTEDMADRITGARDLMDRVGVYIDKLKEREIKTVTRFARPFPVRLLELNDPPPMLYYRGRLPQNQTKTVTLVGASEATNEGIELTTTVAEKLTMEGVQVVSSLRHGIDAAAHLGARGATRTDGAHGYSFSILDSGFDTIKPDDHMPLAIDIAQDGGVITEYPPEQEYQTDNYVQANRLLVGISQAVVVTELYEKSRVVLDLLSFCSQIGQLVFLMIDPRHGARTDETALSKAMTYGAIPMVGMDKVDDIIKSLV